MIDERAVKFHTIANTLVAEQKYNEAITNFLKAIELQPDYDAAIYHLAETYEAKMLEDQAYKYYLQAINVNPMYAMTHIESGLDTLLSGPLGRAVAEYKKMKKIGDAEEAAAGGGGAPAPGGLDGPSAQKGLNPKKILVDGDTELESRVSSTDTISVRVLGDRDVPVFEAPVDFTVVLEDTRMTDAALALKAELLQTAPQRKLTARTDNHGRATIYFRRSSIAGRNVVAISCGKAPGVRIMDTTFAAAVAGIEISPAAPSFNAGVEVTFQARVTDASGNITADRDIVLNLLEREGTNWNVFDAATAKTDHNGVATHTFKLPTLSGAQCRLQALNKESDYTSKIDFKLLSGNMGSSLFIPMKGKVAAGKEFTLKVKLLDEFDNPMSGRAARIVIQDSTGGPWTPGKQNSETTDSQGSVWLMVTPPDAVGATAVFTVEAPGLARESAGTAAFQTVEEGKSDTVQTSGLQESRPSVPDLDLDMELAPPADAGGGLTPDFMADVLNGSQPESREEEISGTGLEGLDYDAETTGFGASAGEEIVEKPPAAGSALDALDSMLGDAPGAPSPRTQSAAPEPDARLYEPEAEGPGLLLPDDIGGPAPEYGGGEQRIEEPAAEETRHDAFEPEPAAEGPDRFELSAPETRGAAGDVVAVTAIALDKQGNPVEGQHVAFMVRDTRGQGGYFEEPTYVATDGRGVAQATFVFDGKPGDETIVTVSHETVPESQIKTLNMVTAGADEAVDDVQPAAAFEPAPAYEAPLPPPAQAPLPAPEAFAPPPAPAFAAPFPGPAPVAFAPPPQPPPPAYQPPAPAFQPPMPPQQPYPQDIQYHQDELPMAQPTQAALGQQYGAQSQAYADPAAGAYDQTDYENLTPEEIMALEDPYALPQFDVKRGKKPPIEMEVLMPQIVRIFLLLVLVVGVVGGVYAAQEKMRFLWVNQKADKLFAQEQLEASVTYYIKAIAISPNNVEPYNKLGEIYRTFAEAEDSKGNIGKKNIMLNQAAQYLNQAIGVQESNRDAHYNLCSVYEYQEKYAEAEGQCKRVLEIDPRYEAAQEKLNSIHLERRRGRK